MVVTGEEIKIFLPVEKAATMSALDPRDRLIIHLFDEVKTFETCFQDAVSCIDELRKILGDMRRSLADAYTHCTCGGSGKLCQFCLAKYGRWDGCHESAMVKKACGGPSEKGSWLTGRWRTAYKEIHPEPQGILDSESWDRDLEAWTEVQNRGLIEGLLKALCTAESSASGSESST